MLAFTNFEEENRQATHLVIWLHGLGASGDDFLPLLPQFHQADLAIRFVLPNAPSQPVTINAGMNMPAWYDLKDLNLNNPNAQDVTGILNSIEAIHKIIDHHTNEQLPSENVFIIGFSQGGAIAALATLTYHKPLGGLLGLSTYLPTIPNLKYPTPAQNCPIFICHGEWDPILPLWVGEQAAKKLKEHGHSVEWHKYPMGHELAPATVHDMICFLKKHMHNQK